MPIQAASGLPDVQQDQQERYSKTNVDKLSLVPLENSSVQLVDQSKCIFAIQDKFKTIKLKSLSKEDMNGW